MMLPELDKKQKWCLEKLSESVKAGLNMFDSGADKS